MESYLQSFNSDCARTLLSSFHRKNEKQLLRRSLDNHMRMMVDTGAKGSKVLVTLHLVLVSSIIYFYFLVWKGFNDGQSFLAMMKTATTTTPITAYYYYCCDYYCYYYYILLSVSVTSIC